MAVSKLKVIKENGAIVEDNIMATYLGDTENNYTYSSLNTKLDKIISDADSALDDAVEDINVKLALKAPIASPAFTGTPTTTVPNESSNDSQIPTTSWVKTLLKDAVDDLNADISTLAGAMIFKGTIGTGGTVTELPVIHNVGWTYRVITAGTYAGVTCEIGDMITCITTGNADNNSHWTVYQTNIDGAVVGPASATDGRLAVFNGTSGKIVKDSGIKASDVVTGPTSAVNNRVAIFNGTSGKLIKDSGFTIGCSVPADAKFTDNNTTYSAGTGLVLNNTTFAIANSGAAAGTYGNNAATLAFGSSFNIPQVIVNAQGQITSASNKAITLPKFAMPINPTAAEISAMPNGAMYLVY